MGNIEVFNDERFGQIRVSGTSDDPMFCLTDICRVLGLHVGMTKQRLDPKGVSLIDTPTNGGVQALIYVNEKNLYKVIIRSDKPQAEPFQDWCVERCCRQYVRLVVILYTRSYLRLISKH